MPTTHRIEGQGGELTYPAGLLNLEFTLTNGQLFRWRKAADGWWDVVTRSRVISIRRVLSDDADSDCFEFRLYPGDADTGLVSTFFRLDVDLVPIYHSWSEADPYLGSLTGKFGGLRVVLQDPEECLLQFICSTANFIPRIMKAVAIIAQTWGTPIPDADGKTITHSFPPASVLASLDPAELSARAGLEWRAANLVKVAQQLADRPEGWLDSLGALDYPSARAELMKIEGVGPKIADVVCLFALAKDQAVPVDTHVWQLTRDRYLPYLKGKSPGTSGYKQVLNYFHTHFVKAGWAQQYLFYDHLLESRARRAQGRGPAQA